MNAPATSSTDLHRKVVQLHDEAIQSYPGILAKALGSKTLPVTKLGLAINPRRTYVLLWMLELDGRIRLQWQLRDGLPVPNQLELVPDQVTSYFSEKHPEFLKSLTRFFLLHIGCSKANICDKLQAAGIELPDFLKSIGYASVLYLLELGMFDFLELVSDVVMPKAGYSNPQLIAELGGKAAINSQATVLP